MPKELLQRPLFEILGEIVSIWIISDIGYYILVPLLGDYISHPFEMAAYYLFWVGLALVTFWDFYKKWETIDVRTSMFAAIFLASVGVVCYLIYLFPLFPPIHWAQGLRPPSELLSASAWYFLPKSIEIALQQLLVAAMVLAFNAQKFSLQTTARWSAVLFGGMHLLMIFSGSSLAYVFFFTASATVAGFIFPYLMLRIHNGFIYSYLLHWGFYAFVIVLSRVLFVA